MKTQTSTGHLRYNNIFDAVTGDPIEASGLKAQADLALLLRDHYQEGSHDEWNLAPRVKTIMEMIGERKEAFIEENLRNWCTLAYGLEAPPADVKPTIAQTHTTDYKSVVMLLRVEDTTVAALEVRTGGEGLEEGALSIHFHETRYYEDWRKATENPFDSTVPAQTQTF